MIISGTRVASATGDVFLQCFNHESEGHRRVYLNALGLVLMCNIFSTMPGPLSLLTLFLP